MTNTVLTLKAAVREETGKRVKKLRTEGKIPAVLYGHKIKPVQLTVGYSDFDKLYQQAGDNTLVDLVINDAKPVKVIVQDHQSDPVTAMFIHVDLHQVDMTEKITTEIPLKFIGEAPAVKELSGVLVIGMDKVEVECLPGDLIKEIEVSLAPLVSYSDLIHVSNLKVPATITIKNKPEDVVAQVQEQRAEEEVTPVVVPEAPADAGAEVEAEADTDAKAGDKAKTADKGSDKK